MKVKIVENENISDTHITIECVKKDETVNQIIQYLKSLEKTLTCKKEREIYQIGIQDIYYIESVDEKTFVYVKDCFYECPYKLYELESQFQSNKFMRINKSCLLNLKYLESVKVLIYGKYEAKLKNGEKLVISRKYMPAFKKEFGI